eukprot:m.215601 g.215601  ORF g.215601 m.215601 type:complete len:97 (+) comp39835_c0_seq7:1768-2058(+)
MHEKDGNDDHENQSVNLDEDDCENYVSKEEEEGESKKELVWPAKAVMKGKPRGSSKTVIGLPKKRAHGKKLRAFLEKLSIEREKSHIEVVSGRKRC